MGKRRKRNNAIKFSKRVVAIVLASVAVFTVIMIAIFIKTGSTPDTLIVSFFSFAGGEAGVLGVIRYGDAKYTSSEDKDQ